MFSPSSKTEPVRTQPWFGRMYWRIWLLMVMTMVLLAAGVTALWRFDLEHDRAARPGAEIVVRDVYGDEIGYARALNSPGSGPPTEFQVFTDGGQVLWVELPRPRLAAGLWDWWPWASWGWVGMVVALGVVFMLVALPLVRSLTRRLEALQQGVEQWGEGNLAARLPETGHDEVAYLARRFNHAAAQVEALVAAHKHLLAHASHELRSPLARIRMGLELLREGSSDHARISAEMVRNIDELDQLIDEVLLASRLEQNPDDIALDEEVDLVGLAAEECARVDASLEVSTEAVLQGNSKLLRRMLRNLLENAKRHGSQQGAAEIQASLSRNAQGQLCLAVADRGPGVPLDWQERVFEPFVRVPGAQEKHGSVGLGLALVRRIALHHGARVACRARPGGGSVFSVVWGLIDKS
jgi:two-component system, OmpR family, sensor kinase